MMQEFALESVSFCGLDCDVEEFGVALIDYIVVPNQLLATLIFRDNVISTSQVIAQKSEPHANEAFLNEVNF